ncbi:TPA: capsular polysaccharide type 5/8 biosynthesis protein CapA [Staphylococcus aureus]|nr:capsular polysaccharide type 5/8 biosynthesis protein CapA [Staphylococcus aureus]
MESTLELTKIKEVLQKNLKILIILPLLFLIISAIVTFFVLSPKYQANTQILVNQTKGDNPQFMAQEVQSNIQLVNTYKEIVKSPRILDEVSKDLNDKYSPSKLSSMLTITNQENTQLINIQVKSGHKQDSEKIANSFAKVTSKQIPKIMSVDNVSILSKADGTAVKADGTAVKVAPKTVVNLIGAFFLGLVVALIYIFFKVIFDKRIKDEEDVEKELGLPVLGSIQKFN